MRMMLEVGNAVLPGGLNLRLIRDASRTGNLFDHVHYPGREEGPLCKCGIYSGLWRRPKAVVDMEEKK